MNVTLEQAVNCTTWKTCTKCNEERKTVFFSKGKAQCKYCDALAYRNRKPKAITTEEHIGWFKKTIKWILS